MVVSEEHTELLLTHGAGEFTQPAVGELGRRLIEKLLRYEGCTQTHCYIYTFHWFTDLLNSNSSNLSKRKSSLKVLKGACPEMAKQ